MFCICFATFWKKISKSLLIQKKFVTLHLQFRRSDHEPAMLTLINCFVRNIALGNSLTTTVSLLVQTLTITFVRNIALAFSL